MLKKKNESDIKKEQGSGIFGGYFLGKDADVGKQTEHCVNKTKPIKVSHLKWHQEQF